MHGVYIYLGTGKVLESSIRDWKKIPEIEVKKV